MVRYCCHYGRYMINVRKRIREMSIRKRMLFMALVISLLVGGTVLLVLGQNYRTVQLNSQYLEHISRINLLYEMNEDNLSILQKVRNGISENNTEQFADNIDNIMLTIDEVGREVSSVESTMRLRVIKYLARTLQSDFQGYVTGLGNAEYADCSDDINRMNSYVQEILRISVSENKQYISEIEAVNARLQILMIIIVVIVTIVSISFNMAFVNYVYKLIDKTVNMTKEIAGGRRKLTIESVEGPFEIQELTDSFNNLLLQLQQKNSLELKVAQDELEQIKMSELLKDARLQGLQMQITPHFLFNTLNIISKMALLSDDNAVYNLIIALSKFLRHSLKDAQSSVAVADEVDMIQQYLYILQVRMGNRLTYTIDNQITMTETQLPLFTLQPIVENAFKHGIEGEINGGKIVVRIKHRGNQLVLNIADNGAGMDSGQLEDIRRKSRQREARFNYDKHIGIENVCCRLNMLFEERVHIVIHSRIHRGTIVTICIKDKEAQYV